MTKYQRHHIESVTYVTSQHEQCADPSLQKVRPSLLVLDYKHHHELFVDRRDAAFQTESCSRPLPNHLKHTVTKHGYGMITRIPLNLFAGN
jgi:hypothetical protein